MYKNKYCFKELTVSKQNNHVTFLRRRIIRLNLTRSIIIYNKDAQLTNTNFKFLKISAGLVNESSQTSCTHYEYMYLIVQSKFKVIIKVLPKHSDTLYVLCIVSALCHDCSNSFPFRKFNLIKTVSVDNETNKRFSYPFLRKENTNLITRDVGEMFTDCILYI